MKKIMINLKEEKGITALDISTGALIFILFTTVILALYTQIYKQSALIKIHQDAMSYIIQICEDIDFKEYGITEDINGYKQNIIEQINFPTDKYELIMTQEKYIETHPDAEDLVKKINVKILYIFDGQERTIEVNKVKVKE